MSLKKLNVSKISLVLGAALALSACGENTKLLGKSLPDETVVVDGPSLELPPEFSLRPPRDGGDYESVLRAQTTVQAQALITGVSATAVSPSATAISATMPSSDVWLLNKTTEQTGAVQPDIRQQLKIDAEGKTDSTAEAETKRKQGLFGRWFGSNAAE